jgi:hypothetical protein
MSRNRWCAVVGCVVSSLAWLGMGLFLPRNADAQSGCTQGCTSGDTKACTGAPTGQCDACNPIGTCEQFSGITTYTGYATNLVTNGNQVVTTYQMVCQQWQGCRSGSPLIGACQYVIFFGPGCNINGIGSCRPCSLGTAVPETYYNQCQIQLGQGCGPS